MNKILICEDDQDLLDITKLIFNERKYELETVLTLNGIEDKVEQFQPDVVLMDLYMPDIDGEEGVHMLRNNPKCAHIPIILFSASPDLEFIAQKLDVDFISKPFDINNIKSKVEYHLKNSIA